MIVYYSLSDKNCLARWLHGQAVKTSPFHGGNTGSIPVGVIAFNAYCISWMHTIEYGDLAKW